MLTNRMSLGVVLVAALLAGGWGVPAAVGQTIIDTPVWDGPDADAINAPGDMVGAGLAQYAAAHDEMLNTHPDILGEQQPSIGQQVMAEVAWIMFQQLEYAITAVHNVLLLQAGRDATILPDTIDPPDTPLHQRVTALESGSSDLTIGGINISDLLSLVGGSS